MNQTSQILKRLLLWVALVLLPGYSYSESIAPYFGQTGNAVTDQSLRWSMGNVLPSPPGLDINGVIYNYTINKDVDDQVNVTVQNENADGTGYIFRETDEWRPGSLGGTQINKVVPVVPSNRALWGDGSIEVDGPGSVTDPTVVYMYRVDPCFDPQFDPNCPGYQVPVPDIPEVSYNIYDPLNDPNVDLDRSTCREGDENPECEGKNGDEGKEELSDEEKAKLEEEEEKDSKERLEKALAAADNSAMFAQALAASRVLDTMNQVVNINTYYAATIPGGTYAESVTLVDKQLPDNKRGLRNNYAQQQLHQQMVDEQYK